MAFDENPELISDVLGSVSTKDRETFTIIIVEHARDAGILQNLLVRSKGISKKDIAQLGYTASDAQNASLLRKAYPFVIVPHDIIVYRPCTFFPPADAKSFIIIDAAQRTVKVKKQKCTQDPFQLTSVL